MLVGITASQYVAIGFGVLVGIAAQVFFGRYCYQYFTKYFRMWKWVRILLSLGGIITYILYVMLDEFTHTSMMGENTRTWKDDPEHGVHILSWGEVSRLQKEGKLEIVEPSGETDHGNRA